MPVRDTSMLSYHEARAELSARARVIYQFLCGRSETSMTDREIKNAIFGKVADMNTVRPRITELLHGDGGARKGHWLIECGTTRCPVTGKRVRLVRAVDWVTRLKLIAGEDVQGELI